MVLSDIDIRKALDNGSITVDPLFPDSIQSASIDVHLGKHFKVFIRDDTPFIDPMKPIEEMMREVEINDKHPYFTLHAGEFALGILEECVGIDNTLIGRLDGKSSVGRLGLFVHITASTLNPGNKLPMTLELFNASHAPIRLYWGMPIAQLLFETLSTPCEHSYGSSALGSKGYGGSKKPQASQYHKNFHAGNDSWREFVKTL